MSATGTDVAVDYDANLAEPSEHQALTVDLYHKERGGKGVWKLIEEGTQIRVTKNVGKRVKLVVSAPIHFTRADMHMSLLDLSDSQPQEALYNLESTTVKGSENGDTIECELKVFTLSKRLTFEVEVCPPNTVRLVGRSVWFGSHNSGKQRRKKEGMVGSTIISVFPIEGGSGGNKRSREMYEMFTDYGAPEVKREQRPSFYFSAYPDYRGRLSYRDLMVAFDIISQFRDRYLSLVYSEEDIIYFLVEESVRIFPEVVFDNSVRYLNLMPVLAVAMLQHASSYGKNEFFRLILELDWNFPLPVVGEEMERLKGDAYKIHSPLPPAPPRGQDHYYGGRSEFQDSGSISMTPSYSPSWGEHSRPVSLSQTLEEIGPGKLFHLVQYKESALAVAICSHFLAQAPNFSLVVYRYDTLLTAKSEELSPECTCVVFSPMTDYTGFYTVTLFFKTPITQFPSNCVLGLYDYRGNALSTKVAYCSPVNTNDHLWVVCNIYVTNTEATFEYSNTVSDVKPRAGSASYPPVTENSPQYYPPPPTSHTQPHPPSHPHSHPHAAHQHPHQQQSTGGAPPQATLLGPSGSPTGPHTSPSSYPPPSQAYPYQQQQRAYSYGHPPPHPQSQIHQTPPPSHQQAAYVSPNPSPRMYYNNGNSNTSNSNSNSNNTEPNSNNFGGHSPQHDMENYPKGHYQHRQQHYGQQQYQQPPIQQPHIPQLPLQQLGQPQQDQTMEIIPPQSQQMQNMPYGHHHLQHSESLYQTEEMNTSKEGEA